MQQFYPNRHLLLFYLPYMVALTLCFGLFIATDYLRFYEIVRNNESLQVDLAAKSLVRDFENTLPDIEVLSNEQHVQNYIVDFNEHVRLQVEQEFISFARQKRNYQMIRLLDNNGMELIRVEYQDGSVQPAPKQDLQDRSQRNYFQEGIELSRGELYLSPVDLNIENDTVIYPYVPTIRFAMPVFDYEDVRRGLLILNYDASIMFRHFDDMLAGSYGHIALLNQDSYYLRSHDKTREWGFVLGHLIRFSSRHAEEWRIISNNDNGQIHTEDGLFTFSSVYPIKLIGGYSRDEVPDQHIGHHHIDPNSYIWKIISDVPNSVFNQKIEQHIFGLAGIVWLILALLGLFMSRYISQSYAERKQLINQIKLHSQIYHTSTDGVIITDADQRILDTNEAFSNISGYSTSELVGKKPSVLSSGRHDSSFYKDMWQALQTCGQWAGEIYNRHKDGSVYVEWIRISAIKDNKGKTSNFIALVSDITQKKDSEEKLLLYAHRDPLTGAHNRLSFDQLLKHELQSAKRHSTKLALIYFDLNKFKPINDNFGHQAGDMVLQTVADRITKNIRETDTLARLGGDEFVVVLSELSSYEDAEKVANTLCYLIGEPIEYRGIHLQISASAGIALYPRDGEDQQSLLHFADQRMYENKSKTKADK